MSVRGRLTKRRTPAIEGSTLLDQFGRCVTGGGRLSHPPVVTRLYGCDRPIWVRRDRAAVRRQNSKEDEMSVIMVRQRVKRESLDEAERAVRDLFGTLDRVGPQGLRYASTRVVDSLTFVILTELADDSEDPRPAIPEYARFLDQLKRWVDGPPVIERLDVIGSYGLFGAGREDSAAA
jgi:hypothetical protein